MTGASAETWGRFRFGPPWRRADGYLPLSSASRRKVLLARWVPLGVVGFAVVLGIAALFVAAAGSTVFLTHTWSAVAYTTWVPDANVTDGPEPGYKPALTSLTGRNIASASSRTDLAGFTAIDIKFDPRGKRLFAQLTRDNVAACPGDAASDPKAACAQRHLAMWLGLTQADINRWEDPTYVLLVGQQWTPRASYTDPKPKLLMDPLTAEEIDGGTVEVSGSFSQSDAQAIVNAIQPRTANNPTDSAAAVILVLACAFLTAGGLVARLITNALVGPKATVMKRQPGQWDTMVELRRVHPAFVAAVLEQERSRAGGQTVGAESSSPPAFPSSS